MSETVARARMFGFHGDWVALERHHYEKHPEGDVVFYEVAEKLEHERDETRRELAELRKNYLALAEEWKKSVFRLARERDEARRERDEAKSIISRLVSRRIISWGDVDSVLEAINEEEEEA